MKNFYQTFTRLTAVALIMAMSAAPVLAATETEPKPPLRPFPSTKSTPAHDKNTNISAVGRAIPDLNPYTDFDPPTPRIFHESIETITPPPRIGAFDIRKLTISGDMRVRPEFRTNGNFSKNGDNNAFFTSQLIRMGFNYDLSPDVVFFLQPQVANNWGSNTSSTNVTGAGNPGGTDTQMFLRQGYMLVRNFVLPNLTMKAGRQLLAWGDHRIFGTFDWNNVGFAFDGVTLRYNHAQFPVELGWLRVAEGNCVANAGGCTNGKASRGDGDILFVRMPMKFGSVAVEPAYIYESGGSTTGGPLTAGGGTATGPVGGQQSNQQRSTVGGRVAFKQGMIDATGEGYWQFGELGVPGQASDTRINALAGHFDAGVTLPVPMQPRIGGEINYATGSSPKNGGHTFSQLFPTNHIHFGYMDLMSWQNMLTYGGNLQMRPTAESHFEIAGHVMRLANSEDNWYTASQATFFNTPAGNKEKSLGGEIDVVYTLFFQNNRVGWQVGYGHFFTGDYLKKNGFGTADQNWGYTQLWINF